MEELALALQLEKVVLASIGGGAPYALGVASYAQERVQGMLLISPIWAAGAHQAGSQTEIQHQGCVCSTC